VGTTMLVGLNIRDEIQRELETETRYFIAAAFRACPSWKLRRQV
jgi:hypothetical protein